MARKSITISIVAIVVLALAIGGVTFLRELQRNEFVWHYSVTDDTQWKTMINDGGSNTNIYYQINFDDLQVRKLEDKYSAALKRYEYSGKVIYQKPIDERIAAKLQNLLEKYWQAGDETEGTYDYYIIEKDIDGKRYIHNKDYIFQIQTYLDKIDQSDADVIID